MSLEINICPLCLESVSSNGVVLSCAAQGCASTFHASCATTLLGRSQSCPTCRRRVSGRPIPVECFVLEQARAYCGGAQRREEVFRSVDALREEVGALHERLRSSLVEDFRVEVDNLRASQTAMLQSSERLEAEVRVAFGVSHARVAEIVQTIRELRAETARTARLAQELSLQIPSAGPGSEADRSKRSRSPRRVVRRAHRS